jgi:flagellar biosynthesis protein FlhF
MHALNRGASVAMITTDNFRVGAIEQLKTYAKIMDIPLEVAATSQELAKTLARHADKDLILIDTAGRSPKDAERLAELKGYLECHPGIETYLCMSATTRARELDEIIATFGVLPITRFLFTKLDESESYGCIVNTHLKHKLPLSYFTTGQKVPEDIEVASARKLAALVVKESTR